MREFHANCVNFTLPPETGGRSRPYGFCKLWVRRTGLLCYGCASRKTEAEWHPRCSAKPEAWSLLTTGDKL